MKKQLTVALGLAVLATPAFATTARLQALGEDAYGSHYINDNRNVWLNPAQVNNHKDLVTYEFGGSSTVSSAADARGEGGVYKTIGNMVYGVHFGGASNTANNLRAAAGLMNVELSDGELVSLEGSMNEENNIDIFVGGDAGVKWGANLGYAKTSDETSIDSAESMRARLGVIAGDTQVYANINLINNAKGELNITDPDAGTPVALGGNAKFEGKLGYQVGAMHSWNGNTLFIDWRAFDMESTIAANGGSFKEDISTQQGEVGIGRVERLNDSTNLFLKASYFMRKIENDQGKASGAYGVLGGTLGVNACELNSGLCDKYETQRVPVVVGIETEATSWLTLRASVSQAVWGTEKKSGDESSIRNSTAVNAGASLKFGELSVDGVIGNSTDNGGIGENTSAGNGTLRTDNLMTRVGMTYRF